jgi:hypothetical protein
MLVGLWHLTFELTGDRRRGPERAKARRRASVSNDLLDRFGTSFLSDSAPPLPEQDWNPGSRDDPKQVPACLQMGGYERERSPPRDRDACKAQRSCL